MARGDRQLGLLWGGAAACAVLLSPLAPLFAGRLWPCPFKLLTGIPCPGCGTTRAALALARFDVVHAFVHFPLQSLGLVFFVAGGLVAAVWTGTGRRLPMLPRPLPGWLVATVLIAAMVNWGYCIATGV